MTDWTPPVTPKRTGYEPERYATEYTDTLAKARNAAKRMKRDGAVQTWIVGEDVVRGWRVDGKWQE